MTYDPEYRKFVISELKKRNLSTQGTFRNLQARYEHALMVEENERQIRQSELFNIRNENIARSKSNSIINGDVLDSISLSLSEVSLSKQSGKKKISKQKDKNERGSESESSHDEETSLSDESSSSDESDDGNDGDLGEIQYDSEQKIYIGNMPFRTVEGELLTQFRPFGEVIDLRIPRKGKHCRGFAFLVYKNRKDAKRAIRNMNNSDFKGRCLRVERARKALKKPTKKKQKKNNEEQIQDEQPMKEKQKKKSVQKKKDKEKALVIKDKASKKKNGPKKDAKKSTAKRKRGNN